MIAGQAAMAMVEAETFWLSMGFAMAVRDLIFYPNPLLRQKADPVTLFDADLAALVADLQETLHAQQGLGITAPHIGILRRVTVIALSAAEGPRPYVNPEILWMSAETRRQEEGSLSMPGVIEALDRPASVRLRYQTVTGELREEAADGLLATCLQHEIDQLDGIFWIFRLSALKRARIVKRYEKLHRRATP